MSYIECEYCGAECYAERSTRKYCSNSCKTMAYRQRIKDEEIARIKQEQKVMIEKYLAIEAEKERIRMNKLIDEMILKQEVRKSEDHQRELERQKQQEIERQEKAEKDRIAKEAKDAKDAYDEALRAVQQDKYAMNSLKEYKGPGANELRGKFNMRNEQHTQAALQNTRERLAREHGVNPEDIKFVLEHFFDQFSSLVCGEDSKIGGKPIRQEKTFWNQVLLVHVDVG